MNSKKPEIAFIILFFYGLIGFLALLIIPSDAKNAWFLGLSPYRLTEAVLILLIIIGVLISGISMHTQNRVATAIAAFLSCYKNKPTIRLAIFFLLHLLALSGVIFLGTWVRYWTDQQVTGYFIRLAPIVLLLALFGLQGLIWTRSSYRVHTALAYRYAAQLFSLLASDKYAPFLRKSLVSIILVMGIYVRVYHFLHIPLNVPYHLGGLFVSFADQILAHNFIPPEVIPFYTQGGIPFGYPPLPFYLLAFGMRLFPGAEIQLVNLIPPLLSIGALVSFYFLAKNTLAGFFAPNAAFFVFSIYPSAFHQQVEAGGLAEAMGTLTLIWMCYFLIRAVKINTFKIWGLAGLLWGINIIASPGGGYAASLFFLITVLLILVRNSERRNKQTVDWLLIAIVIAILVSAPYWLPLMLRNGITFIPESFAAQHINYKGFVSYGLDNIELIAGSPLKASGFIYWLTLTGLFTVFLKHECYLFLWLVGAYLIPREGSWITSIPLALVSGLGVASFVGIIYGQKNQLSPKRLIAPGLFILFCSYMLWTNTAEYLDTKIVEYEVNRLTESAIEVMDYVQENLPEDAVFIVTTYREDVLEWSPYLMSRTVLNMPYGAEWDPVDALKTQSFLEIFLQDEIQSQVLFHYGISEFYWLVEKSTLMENYAEIFSEIWENDQYVVFLVNDESE